MLIKTPMRHNFRFTWMANIKSPDNCSAVEIGHPSASPIRADSSILLLDT